jgi:crotonobetainyl-CoA:carnitine CoA-transferase CaiB-like acyl-CoA transferase
MSEFTFKTVGEFVAEDKPKPKNYSPYGIWTCEDGREVMFNRRYPTIYQRLADGSVSKIDGYEWVESIVAEEWFYDDGTKKAAKASAVRKALNEWGLA